MVRNLRNLFERAGLTTQEVQTLRGVVRALVGRRQRIGNNIR
jgi:tRNA/rRNA methyltransferase